MLSQPLSWKVEVAEKIPYPLGLYDHSISLILTIRLHSLRYPKPRPQTGNRTIKMYELRTPNFRKQQGADSPSTPRASRYSIPSPRPRKQQLKGTATFIACFCEERWQRVSIINILSSKITQTSGKESSTLHFRSRTSRVVYIYP